MFGREYKEDALKWRKMQKDADDKFCKGYAQCEVTVYLVGGDTVIYIEKADNKFYEDWIYNGLDIKCVCAKSFGKDKIKGVFTSNMKKFAINGVTIEETHYMPHTIERIVMGDIVEFEE
jgi:hypothetical protein